MRNFMYNLVKFLSTILFVGIRRVLQEAFPVFFQMSPSVGKIDVRIVGGEECSIELVPFIVSIRSSQRLRHFCGGSLLTPQWVLSAAHCFDKPDKPEDITVLVGLSKNQRGKSQAIRAEKIFNHEAWDDISLINDISLVFLERKLIMFIGVTAFVQLPDRGLGADLSQYCKSSFTAAGWGSTLAWSRIRPLYKPSPHLNCVILPYITNSDCAQYSHHADNENIICTLEPEGGQDACQGDSGGPLYCGRIQYGIVSHGIGCAAPYRPAHYTRVDKYLDFIETTMKSYRGRAYKSCFEFKVTIIMLLVNFYLLSK